MDRVREWIHLPYHTIQRGRLKHLPLYSALPHTPQKEYNRRWTSKKSKATNFSKSYSIQIIRTDTAMHGRHVTSFTFSM
jgi:hypothetical protein